MFLGCAEIVYAFVEHLNHLGKILPESLHDATQGPKEDAAVPKVVAFTDKLHCGVVIGFLFEHFHFHNILECGIMNAEC